MSVRRIVALAALVLLAAPAGAADKPRIEEQWTRPGWERRPFGKVVVLAITDDVQARKNLENKLVSHLRGRRVEAAVSYGVAPDLTALPSRGQVSEFVAGEGIDAAIAIRLVPLEKKGTEAWIETWRETLESGSTLGDLIEQSLPLTDSHASRYGVEITLWDADKRVRLWSGRTAAHGIKQLRKGAADLVQLVIDALKRERLL